MSTASPPEDAVPITINGRTVKPDESYAQDAERTNYITIRAQEPLSKESEAELQDLGVTIQEQVDQDTYLCHYEPSDLQPIRDQKYIQQVDVYRNKFKITEDLETLNALVAAQSEPSQSFTATIPTNGIITANALSSICTVDCLLHRNLTESPEEIASALAIKAHIDKDQLEFASRKVRMTMDRRNLKDVASDDRVRVIEEVFPKVLHNNYAREILCADIRLNDTFYYGDGQVVAVADTGFDKGSKDDCHPAFKDRVIELIPGQREKTSPQANDPVGHGTHVCGSIVGTSQKTAKGEISGIAPKANLVVQSLYFGPGVEIKTPMDLDSLFKEPYQNYNARIHSNSWGDPWVSDIGQKVYNVGAQEIDQFVWDYPDTVICFSAGNDNASHKADGRPAIGAQAAAKNCITVGATGSPRQRADGKNASADQMGSMSNRGPTKEGRIKPDVVAPGVNILSTRSQESEFQAKLAAVAADKNTYPGHPEWQDPSWAIMSGTSMATPLIAGCIAVVREVLAKRGLHSPPAALVKALLINGAVSLPGIPVAAQGFGRVQLQHSIDMLKGNVGDGKRYTCPEDFTSAYSAFAAKPSEVTADCDICGSRENTGYLIGPPQEQSGRYEFTIDIPNTMNSDTSGSSQAFNKGVAFKITLVYTGLFFPCHVYPHL